MRRRTTTPTIEPLDPRITPSSGGGGADIGYQASMGRHAPANPPPPVVQPLIGGLDDSGQGLSDLEVLAAAAAALVDSLGPVDPGSPAEAGDTPDLIDILNGEGTYTTANTRAIGSIASASGSGSGSSSGAGGSGNGQNGQNGGIFVSSGALTT